MSSKRYNKDWNFIRKLILLRDDYICKLCGNKLISKTVCCVHHLDWDINNNNQENLISLCNSCHGKIHMYLIKIDKWDKNAILLGLKLQIEKNNNKPHLIKCGKFINKKQKLLENEENNRIQDSSGFLYMAEGEKNE